MSKSKFRTQVLNILVGQEGRFSKFTLNCFVDEHCYTWTENQPESVLSSSVSELYGLLKGRNVIYPDWMTRSRVIGHSCPSLTGDDRKRILDDHT